MILATQPDMNLVAQASNGHEAIVEFRTHRPDITLMDLQMPKMDGVDAMIAIRSEFPEARIIVLTTFASEVEIQRALEAGACAYILKSLAPSKIMDLIRQVRAGKKDSFRDSSLLGLNLSCLYPTYIRGRGVKACMRLQLEAGLAIVDAVMLHKDELAKEKGKFRIKTTRQKTDNAVNNPISDDLAKLLLKVKNGHPEYFFWSGNTLPEDAPSYFQKLYRKVFAKAGKDYSVDKSGVEHRSHDFRHTFAAYFLEAGHSTEALSKALGHSDIKITQRYYSHFTGKRQAALDADIERTQAAMASGD